MILHLIKTKKIRLTLLTALFLNCTAGVLPSAADDSVPVIALSAKQINVTAEGGTASFSVNANVDYTITSGAWWVKVRRTDRGAVLNIVRNTNSLQRSTLITVRSSDGSLDRQLRVVQGTAIQTPYLFPCTNKLEDPYGVCCHITRTHRDYNIRNLDLNKMKDAGITNVRSDFDDYSVWNGSTWTPTIFDNVLASAQRTGTTFLPILVDQFRKSTSGSQTAWNNLSQYLEYVNYVTRRYKGRIPVWEVMNEIDWYQQNRSGYSIAEMAHRYAKVLPDIANAIHTNDPQAKVMFSGISGVDNSFLETVFADNDSLGNCFDIMNFHFYDKREGGLHYDVPETIIPRIELLYSKMQRYNISKPVWLTETGCTTPGENYHDSLFFCEVVPEALQRLGLDASQITLVLVNDPGNHVTAEDFQEGYFAAFRDVRTIGLDRLVNLSPEKYPVLVPCYGEYFPKAYQDALLKYVRKGGTIILSKGNPFYYDSYSGSTPVAASDHSFETSLHMKVLLPSSNEGKTAGAVLNPTGSPQKADGWNFGYTWTYGTGEETSYLTDANLKTGDTFTPILTAGNDSYSGAVAALYNLGSDLTGNIIAQTRQSMSFKCTEMRQAIRLPRAYLIGFSYGIDKIFWYNLRSLSEDTTLALTERHYGILNQDLSNKQAYLSYGTLISMCPSGSTRPTLETTDEKLYVARWQRTDGKYVAAIWSLGGFMHTMPLTRNLEAFDYLGKTISPQSGLYRITAAPIYFVSEKPLPGFSFN